MPHRTSLCLSLILPAVTIWVTTAAGDVRQSPLPAPFQGGTWSSRFFLPGMNDGTNALISFQGDVIAGGKFTTAGAVTAVGIARWDGAGWHPMGAGFAGYVDAFTVHKGELIAAGNHRSGERQWDGRIARWTGGSWEWIGEDPVRASALISYRDSLFIGDEYRDGVSLWTGTEWKPVLPPAGHEHFDVYALAEHAGCLFAGGYRYLWRWNGNVFEAVATVEGGSIEAMTSYDGKLIVAGGFWQIAGVPATNIAAWDGHEWKPLGEGIRGIEALSLAVSGKDLFVGGSSARAGSPPLFNLARWDGGAWHAVGSQDPFATDTQDGSDYQTAVAAWPSANALLVHDGRLYVGGFFSRVGGVPMSHIATWDGKEWGRVAEPGGMGLSATVLAATSYRGDLIVGGRFTEAGPTTANFIACWDGSRWHPVGGGMDGPVVTLTVFRGNLVATGGFHRAGGATVEDWMASWDGVTWSPVRTGMRYTIMSLAAHKDSLIAGGYITQAGAVPTHSIAAWHRNSWWPLGEGMDPTERPGKPVFALLSSRTGLYAGGLFQTAGGIDVGNVALWDGSRWHGLGGGTDERVFAFADYAGSLVAGGWFQKAGGVPASAIARWDGDSWLPLGEGLQSTSVDDPSVTALRDYQGFLLAGGCFDGAGGLPARNVAVWDGGTWTPLEPGLGGPCSVSYPVLSSVLGFVPKGPEGNGFYAHGDFRQAGDTPSACFAEWEPRREVRLTRFDVTREVNEVVIRWSLDEAASGHPFRLGRMEGNGTRRWLTTGVVDAGGAGEFRDAIPEGPVEYRLEIVLYGERRQVGTASFDPGARVPYLTQNAPNPFRDRTRFEISVVSPGSANFRIFDVAGREVARLLEGHVEAGYRLLEWDGLDFAKRRVPAGVYFSRFEGPDGTFVRRIVKIR